jgi:hypothetical protein
MRQTALTWDTAHLVLTETVKLDDSAARDILLQAELRTGKTENIGTALLTVTWSGPSRNLFTVAYDERPALQSGDDLISALVEARSAHEAQVIANGAPGRLLYQAADLMYLDTDGMGMASVRRAVVAEARA